MVFLGPFLGVERRKTREKSALQALGHPQNVPQKTLDLGVYCEKKSTLRDKNSLRYL